jgi:hypothetical protein
LEQTTTESEGEEVMLEVLQFIFQDFWHFAGIVVLLFVALVMPAYCGAAALGALLANRRSKEKES